MNYDRFRKDFEVEKSTRCGCKTGLQGIHQSFLPLEKKNKSIEASRHLYPCCIQHSYLIHYKMNYFFTV